MHGYPEGDAAIGKNVAVREGTLEDMEKLIESGEPICIIWKHVDSFIREKEY